MRGHDPLRVLLRRQRGPLRDAARRAGRDHLRRAQPRLDHRRRAALQGAPPALRERRHRRAGEAPARGLRRAPAPDRDRRRVLDGRPRRAAAAHLRARRAVRRDGHGRRLARRRLHRSGRPRHAGAAWRRRARRPRHRARSARRSAARAAASRAGGARPSRCCGSARARTSSPTASRRRSWRRAWRCSTCWRSEGAALRERLFRAHASASAASSSALGLDVVPGEHPIVPVMFGDAHRAAAAAERLLEHGVYAVAFSYPVVPLGQARIRTQLSAGALRRGRRPGDRRVRRGRYGLTGADGASERSVASGTAAQRRAGRTRAG